MKRREALQTLGLASSHALFPSILAGFISGCTTNTQEKTALLFFTPKEQNAVIEAIDLMLPATKSKSASAVNTHVFLDEVFAKCMTPQQQKILHEGLNQLMDRPDTQDKFSVFSEIDRKAFEGEEAYAWFKAFKKYTLIGFFTSKEGETVASNYVPIPGDYQGNIPADENTLNYGNTSLRF